MQKYILYIAVVVCSLLPLDANSTDWKKLGNVYVHDMLVKVYVDDDSISENESSDEFRTLWVKFELPKNLISNLDKNEYRIREEKYHFHCGQKLFAVSHMKLLDRNDKTVYDSGSFDPFSEEYDESWKLVTPKSGPDLIYHFICSDLEQNEQQNSADNIEKGDILPKPIIIDEVNETEAVKSKLDVKKVRWAKHDDYERLVLEIFQDGEPVSEAGDYSIGKVEGKNLLKIEVSGLKFINAEFPDIEKSTMLKGIFKDQNLNKDKEGELFIFIEMEDSAEFSYFQLENPGRIVIDFKQKL